MRAGPILAVAALLLLTLFTAWIGRPAAQDVPPIRFELGETWVYDVHESWTGLEPGSATWQSTLRVRATDLPTSSGRASLIESQGAWDAALFGPSYQQDGGKAHGHHLVDPGGWRIVGRGYLEPERGVGGVGSASTNPCVGHILTAELGSAHPPIAPSKVLRRQTHNGSWHQFPLQYHFVTEFVAHDTE